MKWIIDRTKKVLSKSASKRKSGIPKQKSKSPQNKKSDLKIAEREEENGRSNRKGYLTKI